jgi:hypothetical protein
VRLAHWTVALIVGLGAALSSAAPITLHFSGEVSQAPLFDPGNPFGGSIDVGTSIEGAFTFDPGAPDAIADDQQAAYASIGAPFGLSVTFDAVVTLSADSVVIGLCNDCAGSDFYTVLAPAPPAAGLTFALTLTDPSGTALGSDALPAGVPPAPAFALRDFIVTGTLLDAESNEFQVEIVGSIVSLSCASGCVVPEPGSLLLVVAALAALASRPRRTLPRLPTLI